MSPTAAIDHRGEVTRRQFVQVATASLPALAIAPGLLAQAAGKDKRPLFEISLAQWSLHRTLRKGDLDPLDFAQTTKKDYGIDAIEYVNSFYEGKANDRAYLTRLKENAERHAVKSLLIMVDGEGAIGAADTAERARVVENHRKWVEAAKFLGCHSIRVNAQSSGSSDEQRDRAADGLRRLTEFAEPHEINVIVENHGGLSSNGAWLAATIRAVDHPRCGTLPDFGNFCFDWDRSEEPDAWYDRYQGVRELMPLAKAVSAKSNDFNERGDEKTTDFRKMLKIVLDAGYRGYVGIEYEGEGLSEAAGIRATKKLLEKVREEMSRPAGAAG